jgi:hypothetical protein
MRAHGPGRMRRDPRVQRLHRLRADRRTRAAGGFYGTQHTPYGAVRRGPQARDTGRALLALMLLIVLAAVLLTLARYVPHADLLRWLHQTTARPHGGRR